MNETNGGLFSQKEKFNRLNAAVEAYVALQKLGEPDFLDRTEITQEAMARHRENNILRQAAEKKYEQELKKVIETGLSESDIISIAETKIPSEKSPGNSQQGDFWQTVEQKLQEGTDHPERLHELATQTGQELSQRVIESARAVGRTLDKAATSKPGVMSMHRREADDRDNT